MDRSRLRLDDFFVDRVAVWRPIGYDWRVNIDRPPHLTYPAHRKKNDLLGGEEKPKEVNENILAFKRCMAYLIVSHYVRRSGNPTIFVTPPKTKGTPIIYKPENPNKYRDDPGIKYTPGIIESTCYNVKFHYHKGLHHVEGEETCFQFQVMSPSRLSSLVSSECDWEHIELHMSIRKFSNDK